MTYVMTGQCVIIKSSISCQECALLHGRPAISHYANSIMSVLLPVTPAEKRVTDDARPILRNNALTAGRWFAIEKFEKKKREGERRRRKGERKREKLSKVGGIIRPFLKTGKKWFRGLVRSGADLFLARATFFFRGKWGKTGATALVDLIVGDLILRPLLEVLKRAIIGRKYGMLAPQSLPPFI